MDVWRRFEQVTLHVHPDHRLFRSSAPNYDLSGRDVVQHFTQEAVDFLIQNAINGIISFNSHPYSDAAQALLGAANIAYLHLPVEDFAPPTIEQLAQAYNFYRDRRCTLMHCGYGHGRTGVGVTGLQLHVTSGQNPLEDHWRHHNHVERPGQMAVLRRLRDSFPVSSHAEGVAKQLLTLRVTSRRLMQTNKSRKDHQH